MELLTHKKQGSIDLLKDEEKIKSNSQKKVVFTICVVLLLASSLLSAAVFAYSLTQKIRLNNLKKEVDTKIVAWQALEPVSTSIKTISQKNLVISQTSTKYPSLDVKLNKLRDLMPAGTSISTLTLNNQGKLVIAGKATSAAVVYQFYELLKKDAQVTSPVLESLAKSTDYTFSISLNLETK